MSFKKKLMCIFVSILMITPVVPITTSSINVQADAEPQFNEKALSNKTWHQTPAANNINDVHIIKFDSKVPVGEGYYLVEVNGKKFNAAGDSKLGQQIKAHQRNTKEAQIKKQEKAQRRFQQIQQKSREAQEKKAQYKRHKRNQIKKNKTNTNNNKVNKNATKAHRKHYGLIAIIIILIIALFGWVLKTFTKSHRND